MAISPPHPTGPPPPNVDRATPGLLIATWIFFAIAFLVVFVRVYTRFLVKNGAKGWDDFCMIVALLLGLAWAIITSYQVHLGYGRHAAYLPMENASKLGALNIVVTDINALVLFFIRTSICIFLLRMTQGLNNSLQWSISIWIAFTLNALVLIGTIVLYSILCIPLNSLWDLSVQGNCSVLEHATTTIKALGGMHSKNSAYPESKLTQHSYQLPCRFSLRYYSDRHNFEIAAQESHPARLNSDTSQLRSSHRFLQHRTRGVTERSSGE